MKPITKTLAAILKVFEDVFGLVLAVLGDMFYTREE